MNCDVGEATEGLENEALQKSEARDNTPRNERGAIGFYRMEIWSTVLYATVTRFFT